MKDPLLLTILLLLPIFSMVLNFLSGKKEDPFNRESHSLARLSKLWPMILFSLVAAVLGKQLEAPLTFTILASLPLLLFLPLDDTIDPLRNTRTISSLLTIFFASGFLISPDSLWATLFWEGLLISLLFSGTFGRITKVDDIFRTSGVPFPLLISALLFPASQWLSGTLPGQRIHVSLLSFTTGIVALGLFLPSAPFMKWLLLFPDDKLTARSYFQRVALTLVATDGLMRFILPQQSLAGRSFLLSHGHLTLLSMLLVASTLLAQIQGLALAFSEPVLFRRVAYLTFSQSTLLATAILLGGSHRETILTLLSVSLISCTVTIGMPLFHIELQTRHRTLSSLGGLLVNMPRTAILMALGSIAFSGFPGFSLAAAFSFFAFDRWAIPYLLLSLFLVTITGILLGRTLGNLFLGEEPKASYRPRDLSLWSFSLGILLLLPITLLAFYPPSSGHGLFHRPGFNQSLSIKTGSSK